MSPSGSQNIGRRGEAKARAYLEAQGYSFIRSNHHTQRGEVDLIVEKGDTVVFVEVKTRRSRAFGSPAEAVSLSKQKKIVQAALGYIEKWGDGKKNYRFDLVSVTPEGIEHLANAFQAEGEDWSL